MALTERRVDGTTIACPFVYGSIAYWMGRKADEFATHKWTLYVRGPNMEDMSSFISKVVFTLHPSFSAPIREFSEPPYQVSEFGWGEFEAGIRVFFRDPEEQPIDLIHQIKLYPASPEGMDQKSLGAPPQQNSKKPVVSEQYDEAVFTDPTESFKRLLMLYSTFSVDSRAADASGMEHYTRFDDTADLEHLASIQDHIKRETDAAKIRLLQLDVEINQILSDPNVILKPSTAPPPTTASIAFVPASFSTLLAEGLAGGGAAKSSGTAGEKAQVIKSRGAATVMKASSSKPTASSTGAGGAVTFPSGSAPWGSETAAAPSTDASSTATAVVPVASAAASKKKAQASAAAAAAVKQMELFSSVRM